MIRILLSFIPLFQFLYFLHIKSCEETEVSLHQMSTVKT
ncbi:hypothetical protein LEMLEM_LOCUS12730 [Lemmus lemmus]